MDYKLNYLLIMTFLLLLPGCGGGSSGGGKNIPSNEIVAPNNLQALLISNEQIQLNWQDNSNNESGFKIERKIGAEGIFQEIFSTGSNKTTHIDTDIDLNTSYYYRVRAFNSNNFSGYSNEVSINTGNAETGLNKPTNLTVEIIAPNQILLKWTDTSTTETGYEIERNQQKVGSTEQNVTSYTDEFTFSPNIEYQYRIRAYNNNDFSDYSDTVSVTPNGLRAPNLSYSPTTNNTIHLYWINYSYDEEGFKIERKEEGSSYFQEIASVDAKVNIYDDSNIIYNKTYVYRIRAFKSNIYSDYSNELSILALNYGKPSSPSGLTAVYNDGKVKLNWSDGSDNEQGFKISRRANNEGLFSEVGTVTYNTTEYTDPYEVKTDTYYTYEVIAFNKYGISPSYSAQTSIIIPGRPNTPSYFTANVISSSPPFVSLSWNDKSLVESGFEIYRKKDSESYTLLTTVTENVTYYRDYFSTDGSYTYKIRAVNSEGCSDYTPEISINTTGNIGVIIQ